VGKTVNSQNLMILFHILLSFLHIGSGFLFKYFWLLHYFGIFEEDGVAVACYCSSSIFFISYCLYIDLIFAENSLGYYSRNNCKTEN